MSTNMYRRQRTASAYEERNVSEFVNTCLKFTTNITCCPSGSAVAAKAVLLLGTRFQLTGAYPTTLPFFCSELVAPIKQAPTGGLYRTAFNGLRVMVGCVPTEASRHNCPTRPDAITSMVAEAQSEAVTQDLDIFVCSPEELCIASAVARAYHPFTAKRGAAEQGYLADLPRVRIIFPTATVDARSLRAVTTRLQLAMLLVDAPTNLLDTTTFTEIASNLATAAGCTVEVISGEDLREGGYGGLYGVGKAAEFPPALVTLTYSPPTAVTSVAFVGKGIVYDTGGLAIKTPATSMCSMKGDMGGAAAVFAAFLAAAELQLPVRLTCTLCLADNAIGPRSQRNDDIVRLKSGLTVEINNTDAEGRLVLSDGIYAATSANPPPDVVIDMATLTGAQGIATGQRHAAVLANHDEIEQRSLSAGRRSGDLVFPIVYCPELLLREFKSTVADHRNSVANRENAQSSCAGHFIEASINPSFKGQWLHVDIAYPSKQGGFSTGYGVALLFQMLLDGISASSKA